MNVLVVTGKPAVSRWIAPSVRLHWPTDAITFVHIVPYGNLKFLYPRGLRMQDYPTVSAPVHGLVRWENWACRPLVLDDKGELLEVAMTPDLITDADHVVFACDPDHTGAVAFRILMRVVFGDERALQCPALRLTAFDPESLALAFSEMRTFGDSFKSSLVYGDVKHHFDWNWNVNSLGVLGAAMRRAGVPGDAPPLSKFSLQLLYALRSESPGNEGQVIRLMHAWPGTGRYKHAPGRWRPRLGSPASATQIVENLVEAGLLNRHATETQTKLRMSERGHHLLEMLHPDCEDPDLPFRLDTWCNAGLQSKPAIDRYIRTFFGKQMRFRTRR